MSSTGMTRREGTWIRVIALLVGPNCNVRTVMSYTVVRIFYFGSFFITVIIIKVVEFN
ncbi:MULTISPECIES: hypothetical protein [Wolbachia]|uniref:hypothetical protein n=1 Tax=Wolbachia TaxID=953 RepID=UPI00222F60B2|nr:hypothetical protein [Wolbachia endosymbiont (group A) of Calamotropha paludella]